MFESKPPLICKDSECPFNKPYFLNPNGLPVPVCERVRDLGPLIDPMAIVKNCWKPVILYEEKERRNL